MTFSFQVTNLIGFFIPLHLQIQYAFLISASCSHGPNIMDIFRSFITREANFLLIACRWLKIWRDVFSADDAVFSLIAMSFERGNGPFPFAGL